MKRTKSTIGLATTVAGLLLFSGHVQLAAQSPAAEVTQRHFHFTYSGIIKDLTADSRIRVWIPVASDTDYQQVVQMTSNLPVEVQINEEAEHGNRMIYFEIERNSVDEIPFSIAYEIRRREVNNSRADDEKLDEATRAIYLKANRLVPVDGKPLELLSDWEAPEDQSVAARQLYDLVLDYMRYDKSIPGYGNGDSNWACESHTGNCTDFHSLFMSLARSQGIPVNFEIGFPLPPERGAGSIGGYHCWANFFVDGNGWTPVDISEADKHPEMAEYYFGNLTENRVTFTKGRDLTLQPPQDGEPLNYFIYPYVEVDGQPLGKDHIELKFGYADQ